MVDKYICFVTTSQAPNPLHIDQPFLECDSVPHKQQHLSRIYGALDIRNKSRKPIVYKMFFAITSPWQAKFYLQHRPWPGKQEEKLH